MRSVKKLRIVNSRFLKGNGKMDEKKTMDHECCKHIKGIKCNVKNCYYHDCDTYCTASQIAVGPQNAECSTDTLCATFKPKEF